MTSRFRLATALLAATLALLAPLSTLAQQTPPEERLAGYDRHVEMKAQSAFTNLPWQFLGPTNTSGRMTDVAVVAPKGENYTIYVAGASGGVWRTDNEGTTWEPVFEHGPSTSIGDVTIDPNDPNTIWVGTGEANIFRSSMAGAGVFKSTDRGTTWTYKGLAGTHTIGRIIVNPHHSNVVYVAASGHEWTDNEERGLYKSEDGGETWTKILYVDERTGVIDLVMDPGDPHTLYASTWQRIRRKWNDPRVEPGYGKSGVWKSTDNGATWAQINEGLPAPEHRGRIGLDVSRSNPNIVYAFVDNHESARMPDDEATDAYGRPAGPIIRGATVFRSDDAGASWRRTSEYNREMETLAGTYGWVFGQIRVDPNLPDRIYLMGVPLKVSNDAGQTWTTLDGMHGDHHGLWIDPDNSNYLVNVNDGGVAISYDAGENWRTFYDNLPLVQFFNVSVDMDEPFHAYGSVQDHGSRRAVVDLSRGRHAIPAVEWQNAPGGEGSRHAIDPTEPATVYSAGFYGTISRTDVVEDASTAIIPRLDVEGARLRGQWLAPFIISPHNPRILYHGMNYLFRSMDRGDKWDRISPDLTYNDPAQLGDIPYQTIFTIAESPFRFGRLWVGTDDGRVWRTNDSGTNWTELTSKFPRRRWISRIVASAHAEGRVYLTQNGKRDDDFTPYVWHSDDGGDTWRSIAAGVPSGPVNSIAEDPRNADVLYLATDLSAYVSFDRGATWDVLAADLPTTFVSDLAVQPREDILVASTHGRGMYAIDVRNVQRVTPEVRASDLHVFPVEPARLGQGWRSPGVDAVIWYWVSAARTVSVTILDESGAKAKTLEDTAERGLNRVVWNLTNSQDRPVDTYKFTVVVKANGFEGRETVVVR